MSFPAQKIRVIVSIEPLKLNKQIMKEEIDST